MSKRDLERKLDWELALINLLNTEKHEIIVRMQEYRDEVHRATHEKEMYRKAMTDQMNTFDVRTKQMEILQNTNMLKIQELNQTNMLESNRVENLSDRLEQTTY